MAKTEQGTVQARRDQDVALLYELSQQLSAFAAERWQHQLTCFLVITVDRDDDPPF